MPVAYTATMTDYPDWQAYPSAQSDNLFPAANQVLAPGLHSTPVIPAVNWSSVTVLVQPSAGACHVQLAHFADQAATILTGSDTLPANATTALLVRTPLRGRYFRVNVTVTSPGNMTALTWASLASAPASRLSFPVGQQNAHDLGRTLAAGATTTYSPGFIVAGLALAYLKPYDATGKLTMVIRAVDELGNTVAPVADFGAPAALTQQLITVPDEILQVVVTNTDLAGPHTYDLAVTIPPC